MLNKKIVKIKKIKKDIPLPQYATNLSACMDLMAAIEQPVVLNPGERSLIPSGISVALPEGYELQIRPRSGLAIKNGISLVNSPGTIDADYRGEIGVIIINHGNEIFTIEPNMRIAQAVVKEYTNVEWDEVDELDETERGSGGFGASGV